MVRVRNAGFLVVALAAAAASCRTAAPSPVDTGMAACVSPDTVLLAGLNLAQVRSSPLSHKLPLAAALLDSVPDASALLLAFDGKELLTVARGSFHAAPAGWTLIDASLAVSGSDAAVRAAIARHQSGASTSGLMGDAASVAGGNSIWVVGAGGATLPLTGNAANLNRLLRDSDYAAITVALGPPIRIEATVVGRTPEAARDAEETLRGVLALMAMAERRGSDVAVLLQGVDIRRDRRTVHAVVPATADALGKLLEQVGR